MAKKGGSKAASTTADESEAASTTADESEVRSGFSDLILGQGPKAPTYGRVFSQASSLRFYTQYQEYERSMELCNAGQSIQRPVLQLTQLLPKSIRSCLSRTYFNGDELEDDDLWEALAKHAECWEGDEIDPSIAAATVTRLCAMGNERTATDRVDAVQSRLETYFFENPSAERVFRDKGKQVQERPCLHHKQSICWRAAPARIQDQGAARARHALWLEGQTRRRL